VHSEQRKEVRSIYPHQPKGKLQVLLNDTRLPVSTVKDVSPSGIRLEVRTQIPIGENIQVRYVDEKVDLKLNGTVAWNSISSRETEDFAESPAFLIGIRLASPSLLQVVW
jgi:hypothetical protein